MMREPSKFRLYAMKFVYLFNAAVIGFSAWSELLRQERLITGGKPWDLIYGIAFSLYAAYALLLLLGVRFPLKMLPLLLLQLFYKSIWLIAVGYPLWSTGRLNPAAIESIRFFSAIVALDLLVIPWPHVFDNYFRALLTLVDRRGPSAKAQPS